MTSTLCQSAALERIFAPWTAKIAVFLHTIVKTILTIAEIVRTTLREFGTCCRKAGQRLLALRPGLSWPMMPKLKTMGRHARLLRHRTGFASALHADIGAAPAEDHRQLQGRSRRLLVRADTRSLASHVTAIVADRSREEQPAEANGDDAEGKLMDLEEPEGHDTGSERQACPHVKC